MEMYKIFVGNAYDVFGNGDVICTTTNGEIKKNGRAVMGKGIAQFVRDNFEDIDLKLAGLLKQYGNRAFNLGKYSYDKRDVVMATFPTKHKWNAPSDIDLIGTSAQQIKEMADKFGWKKIYIPIPGCSNGQLKWSQVKGRLNCLDDRFIIFSLNESDFEK